MQFFQINDKCYTDIKIFLNENDNCYQSPFQRIKINCNSIQLNAMMEKIVLTTTKRGENEYNKLFKINKYHYM